MAISGGFVTRRRQPVIIFLALLLALSLFYYGNQQVEIVKLPPIPPLPELPGWASALVPSPVTEQPELELKPPPPTCPISTDERASQKKPQPSAAQPHPIDELIRKGNSEFEQLLAKEVNDLHSAAEAYRSRRGRHPPPRFDQWVEWAQAHNVILIEDLYDQIYDDLEPFWALPAQDIREVAASHEYVLSIRNGNLTEEDGRYRMLLWHDMLKQLTGLLPDVDLAWNIMDESRVVVPHEKISEYIAVGSKRARIAQYSTPGVTEFAVLPPPRNSRMVAEPIVEWIRDQDMWLVVREGCPPDSLARRADPIDINATPEFPIGFPNGSYEGYVSNWTFAKDPCEHPHLRGLHGTFIEPVSISTTRSLFPILGGSKLPMNNDILVPAPRYWEADPRFAGGEEYCSEWDGKRDAVTWRGVDSGGRNNADNWRHFQRHRFISMLNTSHVRDAMNQQSGADLFNAPSGQLGPRPAIFQLPDSEHPYEVAAITYHNFAHWLESFSSDNGFIFFECFPREPPEFEGHCPYNEAYFDLVEGMSMPTMFEYKYLPDIDGNSFSGRYRAFLGSHSLPIKATVYSEWHDSRLVAWKHFVPMDNTFVDFYAIMDYFLGYDGGMNEENARAGHDEAARKIAQEGQQWADKVLRREDMLAYVYRLILEYARIVDERREDMGFTADLPSANAAVGKHPPS